MYLACLTLPANLLESDLERLGPALDGLNTGYYAGRDIEDDDSSVWLMRWITEDRPNISDFTLRLNIWAETQNIDLSIAEKDWSIEEIDESIDWLAESYKGFQPFEIEGFYIYGSHYEGAVPNNKILLQIDAATAFGSGEHPTTEGCLKALLDLKDQGFIPDKILDMGCGSGILAIAAAKIFPNSQIIAIDIDPESIDVTRRHQKLNNISEERIISAAGNGFEAELSLQNEPYNLVIANILAGPLKDMAPALMNATKSNGTVILSGLLNEQAEDVLKAYEPMQKIDHKEIKEWSTLTLQKA